VHGLLQFAPLLALGWRDRARLFPSPAWRAAAALFAVCVWNVARLRDPIVGARAVVSAWYHPLLAAPLIAAIGLLAVFGWRMIQVGGSDDHEDTQLHA
jgi:hypothetical protein